MKLLPCHQNKKNIACLDNGFIKSLTLLVLAAITAGAVTFDFENDATGSAPEKWQCRSVWKVHSDADAPSGKQVLSMVENKSGVLGMGMGFNTCYTPQMHLKDGTLSVRFRADSGRIDQGGGIMWRVQRGNTYYVARFNPLEGNFRFYKVMNGSRSLLASTNLKLQPGWHTMTVRQAGEYFEGSIDGKRVLKARDSSIAHAGGVGVWTKADAATSFDDLVVEAK